jgi:hypothetical protein
VNRCGRLALATLLSIWPLAVWGATPPHDRWRLDIAPSITWQVAGAPLPHADFIEQGGRRAGQKVWYTIAADGTLHVERDVVWPSLRIFPNDTHGSLIHHYGADSEPKITVDGAALGSIKISEVRLDGTLAFRGKWRSLAIQRVTFPAVRVYATVERWTLTNEGKRPVGVAVTGPVCSAEQKGPYGSNVMAIGCDAPANTRLAAGASLTFYLQFTARQADTRPVLVDGCQEEQRRRAFVAQLDDSLRLETPDPVLDRAFTFAKWRVAEAMNDTRGGLMLGPGNLRYYAATWCNDNVEYAGPFFPFLGDDGGNQGSLNTYRQYMPYMKPDYRRIPCSIIAEGTSTWGPFDRGDAAMYAYGAARFALAYGNRAVAEELWKGIVWTLEYCRRRQLPAGVIASESDELEGRLPAGHANLTTSSLCYGGLRSAANLGRALGKDAQAKRYDCQADVLRRAIASYFGHTVEGFDTYRYYDGNNRLRSWICIPLCMGILDRKQGTLDALFSPRLWSDDGVASQSGDVVFWDRSTLYALRGAFQAGATARALDFLTRYSHRRLLGEHVPYAVEAYPEGGQGHLAAESGLYCRIFVEGLFGILPTGLDRFQCTPQLPDGWRTMALRRIKAFGSDFDIVVTRRGTRQQRVQVLLRGATLLDKTIESGHSVEVVLAGGGKQ